MSLVTRIELAPAVRPVGGLLAAARPLDGEWWRGVTFSTPSCIAPLTIGACDDGTVTKTYERPSTIAVFEAFGILQAVECTSLGNTDVGPLAEASLDVTREFAVARELLTGAASGNPNLRDATDLGMAANPVEALGCLDQFIGDCLSGRLAYIHASPSIGTAWAAASAIYRDGNVWRTALGSKVIISAGYDGRPPGGGAPVGGVPPSAGDTLYAYATGEVYAAVGNRDTQKALDRALNTWQGWSEEAALAVFDPCCMAAIDTTVVYCPGLAS